MQMQFSLFTLAMMLLAGCTTPPASTPNGSSGAPADVQLTVDRASYRAGDPITLMLTNRSSQQIGYNLCSAALEQRSGDSWHEAQQRLAEVCTMELRTLAPNGSDTYRHTLPASLPAGEYRVRANAEAPLGSTFTGVASSAFQVSS